MKFIFNTNGNILESENTESIIQFSVNANEIYMTFARMPMAEYIGYISFERADGKTSPLIGMQYCSFPSPSGEPMIGFKYSFSDAWVTAVAGILKVVFTLKRNGIVIKTATINLNVIESIAEDEVNYIDDVAYNELLSRMQSFEITAENLSATNLIQEQKIKDLAFKLNSTIISNNVGSIQSKSITNEINTLITKGVYLLQQIQYDVGSISHPITALMFVKEITSGIVVQTILFEFGDRINYLTRTIDSRTGNININISERKIITHAEDIPTRLGQLENDMHFALQSSVPTKLSQLQDDSDFVNTSELKEYVNSKSPKNIGELESDPENKNNIVLNNLNEDGIYHFTYQGENGIIFVKKISTTVDGNYDIVQSILYNPKEFGYESSLLRRLIFVENNTIRDVDIFNMGTLATTQEYLSYLQHEYYNKEKVNELLSLIPKFNIEVVQELPTSEISDTTVYLIPSGDEDNLYTEYIYVNGKWEILGIQAVDLTGYAKTEDVLDMIDRATSIFNIGELNSDPTDANNTTLNSLDLDGIYKFTYQSVNGIIFVKKIVHNAAGTFTIVQSILYNPRENGYELSLVRRTIDYFSYDLISVDILNQGVVTTTQEFLNYLQHEYLTKVEIEELIDAKISNNITSLLINKY